MSSQVSPTFDCPIELIAHRAPGFTPRLGIVLGSGLGGFVEHIEKKVSIPYTDLPGFSACTVPGHLGVMHLGYVHSVPVACMQGRPHVYENVPRQAFLTFIRTLKVLGCDSIILSNAAGSLKSAIQPESLVLLTDHINMMGFHPLIGENDTKFGPRFPDMGDAYDLGLREIFLTTAKKQRILLHEGVYLALSGPSFETAAEIKAFSMFGADIVGMSTVPETLVARHSGLKVAAISVVTNMGTGLNPEAHSHEHTLASAARAGEQFALLLENFIKELE